MSARLSVWVQPRSGADAVGGMRGEALKVRVAVAPERGKANRSVEGILARAFGVRKSSVRVISGAASREKVVEIEGLDQRDVARPLAEWRSVGG